MIFERPELLALAPLVAILFAFAVGAHWLRLRRLAAAYQPNALRRLLPTHPGRFPTQRFLCLVAAGVLLGLAPAGPVLWDPEPPDLVPRLDLAIAVDLSLSMSAPGGTGSRIERAREAMYRLTEELPSVRFSLVVFAGWPYVLVPPTDDADVIRYFIDSLDPEVVQERDRGNSLGRALEVAASALEARPSEDGRGAILVFTDGDVFEEEDSLVRAAADLAAGGVGVWIAGVGSEEGSPISIAGDLGIELAGGPVRTRQHTELLSAMADAGQGRYEDITEDQALDALVSNLRDLSGDSREAPAEPFDTTALFALLALPLLLWEGFVDARRGVVGARTEGGSNASSAERDQPERARAA